MQGIKNINNMVGNTSKDYTDAVNQERIEYLKNYPEALFDEPVTTEQDDLKKELKTVLRKLGGIDVKGGLK